MGRYVPSPLRWRKGDKCWEMTDGREFSADEVEFMLAVEREQRRRRVLRLGDADLLRVAKSLGYRREGC